MGEANDFIPGPNSTFGDLRIAQIYHDLWAKSYLLTRISEQNIITQSLSTICTIVLTQEKGLCRCCPHETELVKQCIIPELYAHVVLKLLHDMSTGAHPGR